VRAHLRRTVLTSSVRLLRDSRSYCQQNSMSAVLIRTNRQSPKSRLVQVLGCTGVGCGSYGGREPRLRWACRGFVAAHPLAPCGTQGCSHCGALFRNHLARSAKQSDVVQTSMDGWILFQPVGVRHGRLHDVDVHVLRPSNSAFLAASRDTDRRTH
jgi:hypothetical protein